MKASRLYGTLHDRGRVHNGIWSNKRSYLAATANHGFQGLRSGIRIHSDSILWLSECNTTHAESDHSRKEEAHRGTASSLPGAYHGKETWNLEDRHWAEHRRQPDEATDRWPIQNPNRTYGTTTELTNKSRNKGRPPGLPPIVIEEDAKRIRPECNN